MCDIGKLFHQRSPQGPFSQFPNGPLRSVRRTLNLGVVLNLTQTPIGFVPFHGQSARCRAQSYPDPHWLRSVPRPVGPVSGSILPRPPLASFRSTASRPGVGLNLTQTPIGFVPFHGQSARCRAQSYPDPHWLRSVPRPVGPVSGSILP